MEFTGDLRGRDFTGQDLFGAVFRDADLYQARFTGARLERATFHNCFIAEAAFDEIRGANLQAIGCSFYRASFRAADLTGALLWKCVLAGADFSGARLKGLTVTLDCNSFEGVTLDRIASAELAYLFSHALTPHRRQWLALVGQRYAARLDHALQQ